MSILATIGATALDQTRLRERLDGLARQVATGQLGTTHGALGTAAQRAIDLRGEVARREAYAIAADAALARMGTAQGVLARLETIVAEVGAEAMRARTFGASGVEGLARTARAALEEAAALLNARANGEYLFGGSDLGSPPVPGAAGILAGPMASAIAAAVATLNPTNAAAVRAATAVAATDPATAPFSAHLEGPALAEPRRAVQVADGERVAWGVLASQDAGGEVALAWGREMLRGLATLAALTPASAAQEGGYDDLLAGVAGDLVVAGRGLAQERGVLGVAEKRVEATREWHRDTLVTLRTQVRSVEGVDLAEVSAALRETQLRLEASYATTARIAGLSLASLLR
jgi:flagellin-like hook-associated protein FlgL